VDEPTYVEAGDEFGELSQARGQRAQWQTPKGKWQKRLLKAVGREYYKSKAKGGRYEQTSCNTIARQAVPMELSADGYPEEWIEFCCKWAEGKRREHPPKWISLTGLLSFITNNNSKADWLSKNQGKVDLTPKDEDWSWE
jgi:hypothetical protein